MPNTNWIVLQDGAVCPIDDSTTVDSSLLKSGESEGVEDTGMGILERTISQFAKQAYRTILLTYKDFTEDEYNELKSQNNDFEKEEDRECLEDDLTAVGIWGI